MSGVTQFSLPSVASEIFMSNLFDAAPPLNPLPLAADLRPMSLEEIVGQADILAPDSILRRRIKAGRLGSIVLYGPPGTGKTTIARAVGALRGREFRPLHATRAGVTEIRKVADEARMRPVLLFIDEIHRLSVSQSEDLLALAEDGVLDLISATTSNPYHALPSGLISRSTILQMHGLSVDDICEIVKRGLRHLEQTLGTRVTLSETQLRMIAGRSSGDARRALTTIESLCVGHASGEVAITQAMIDEAYAAAPVNFDRAGDGHYDATSAFIKSMRGSDPDATLYWLARLIHAGEDPRYIARRLMVHASEDVGLADPTALQTAVAALHAVEKIGYPEAQIVLAHAALHIARAPKSNSACRGISLAMAHVKSEGATPVPMHLRDTHYSGAAALGHVGYKFPHDDARGWAEQEYAPGIAPGTFYQSDARTAATFERRADEFWQGVTGNPQPRREW